MQSNNKCTFVMCLHALTHVTANVWHALLFVRIMTLSVVHTVSVHTHAINKLDQVGQYQNRCSTIFSVIISAIFWVFWYSVRQACIEVWLKCIKRSLISPWHVRGDIWFLAAAYQYWPSPVWHVLMTWCLVRMEINLHVAFTPWFVSGTDIFLAWGLNEQLKN